VAWKDRNIKLTDMWPTLRQLARWCWGVIGKDIRVVLPSFAVSCIRAHFPLPGQEDDFVFVGVSFSRRVR
jgi:hypothetical protein